MRWTERAGDRERTRRERDGTGNGSDECSAWSKKKTRNSDDDDVESDIGSLDDFRIPNEPRDQQCVRGELESCLCEDVFGEAEDKRINDCQAGDNREESKTLIDRLLRLSGPGPNSSEDAKEECGNESPGDEPAKFRSRRSTGLARVFWRRHRRKSVSQRWLSFSVNLFANVLDALLPLRGIACHVKNRENDYELILN